MDPKFVAPTIVYLATDEAKDINGQYMYVCGGDVCIYSKPFQIQAKPHTLIRKTTGKWTIDELNEVIPPIVE